MDTTYITVSSTGQALGLSALKDTYNLLAGGIVKLMRALAAVEGVPVRRWAETHGYKGYVGSSVKGEAAIAWSNRRARQRLWGQIVADADSAERPAIVDAAELLGQLLLQDVQCNMDDGDAAAAADDGGEVSLKEGVSKDRMVSVHDPEMRHGQQTRRKRFDGHKAAVVVATDPQLITAVGVLPGNAHDNLGALELVEQSEAGADVPVVEAMGEPLTATAAPARFSPMPGASWCLEHRVVPTGSVSPRRTSS